MKSYLNKAGLPRGIRNNNPGNLVKTTIKWKGKIPHANNPDSRFEQFETVALGIRAMAMDVLNDIKKGKNTLRVLITEYAPPSENDTTAYINSVSKQTGIGPDEKIKTTPEALAAILRAKIRVENGPKAETLIDKTDIDEALKLLPGKFTTAVKVGGTLLPFLLIGLFLIFRK
jgi:hypothetical protein